MSVGFDKQEYNRGDNLTQGGKSYTIFHNKDNPVKGTVDDNYWDNELT